MMIKKNNKVSIFLKPQNNKILKKLIKSILTLLSNENLNVSFLKKEEERLSKILSLKKYENVLFEAEEKILKNSILAVSLGGDGTLIGVCRLKDLNKTPVLGINLGNLGFITEVTIEESLKFLEKSLKSKPTLIKKDLFSVEIIKNKNVLRKEFFINDVVLHKYGISRMFELSVFADNEKIFDLSGDGIIISSPTGSTAYSMASGGPIVHPEVKSLIVTPICPHALTHRPIVLNDKMSLTIKATHNDTDLVLTLDGQMGIKIENKEIIKVKKIKSKPVYLVSNPKKQYFSSLREKFTLGERLRKLR